MHETPFLDLVDSKRIVPLVTAFSKIFFMVVDSCELIRKKTFHMKKEHLGIRRDITQEHMLFSYSPFPPFLFQHPYYGDDNCKAFPEPDWQLHCPVTTATTTTQTAPIWVSNCERGFGTA